MSNTPGTTTGSLRFVELRVVFQCMLERIHAEFGQLVQALSGEVDEARRRALLCYLHSARQQMLRMVQLLRWANKARALASAADHGSVLDVAAQHAAAFRTAADELAETHAQLMGMCAPNCDVQTALEVLTSGGFHQLPSIIEDICPVVPPAPAKQRAIIRHMDHLLYSHLLKASLPPGLVLVRISDGAAVLRLPGLYEIRLTLVPAPIPPPQPDDPEHASAPSQQQGADGEASSDRNQAGASTSGAPDVDPRHHWRWALIGVALLPNAAKGAPLQEVQLEGLHRELRNRMDTVADAVLLQQRKRRQPPQPPPPAVDADADAANDEPTALVKLEPMDTDVPPLVKVEVGSPVEAKPQEPQETQPPPPAATPATEEDEHGAPLLMVHDILREIAARLALDAVREAAAAMVGPGGRWLGHARLDPPQRLSPGIRITYWLKAAFQDPNDVEARKRVQPSIEIGMSEHGGVEVIHEPALVSYPSKAPVPLSLDLHEVDVEGVVLQAAAVCAMNHLEIIRSVMQRNLLTFTYAPIQFHWAQDTSPSHLPQPSDAGYDRTQPADETAQASTSGRPEGLRHSVCSARLDVLAGGERIVTLSINLWSGRLALRPGGGLGQEATLEALVLAHSEEQRLYREQMEVMTACSADDDAANPNLRTRRAFTAVGKQLASYCERLVVAAWVTRSVMAARQLELHMYQNFRRELLVSFVERNPWAAWMLKQQAHTYAFPVRPPPRGLGGGGRGRGSSDASMPRCAQFALFMEFTSLASPRYALVMLSTNLQGLPLEVLKAIPVPQLLSQPNTDALTPAANHEAEARSSLGKRKREVDERPGRSDTLPSRGSLPELAGTAGTASPAAAGCVPDWQSVRACWGSVVGWCHSVMVREQLIWQLGLLGVHYSEWIPAMQRSAPGEPGGSCGPFERPTLVVEELPGLFRLPYRISRRGKGTAGVSVDQVCLCVDEPASAAGWSCYVTGSFFPSPEPHDGGEDRRADSTPVPGGLRFRYSLNRGDSVVSAVLDVLRTVRMQTLLYRLSTLVPSKPKPRRQPDAAPAAAANHVPSVLGLPPSGLPPLKSPFASLSAQTSDEVLQAVLGDVDPRLPTLPSVDPFPQINSAFLPNESLGQLSADPNVLLALDSFKDLGWDLKAVPSWEVQGPTPGTSSNHGATPHAPGANGYANHRHDEDSPGPPVAPQDPPDNLPEQSLNDAVADGAPDSPHGIELQWLGTAGVRLHSCSITRAVLGVSLPAQQVQPAGKATGRDLKPSAPSPSNPLARYIIEWKSNFLDEQKHQHSSAPGQAAAADPLAASPGPVHTPALSPLGIPAPSPEPAGAAGAQTAPPASPAPPSQQPSQPLLQRLASSLECSISVRPSGALPDCPSVCAVLSDMVQCCEEGLMLDALAVATWPLTQIAHSLSPAQLRQAGLVPGSVLCRPSDPPYCFRVLIDPTQHSQRPTTLDLRFFCFGLTVMTIGDAPAGPDPSQLHAVISRMRGVYAVPGEAPPRRLWVLNAELAAVLGEVYRHLAHVS